MFTRQRQSDPIRHPRSHQPTAGGCRNGTAHTPPSPQKVLLDDAGNGLGLLKGWKSGDCTWCPWAWLAKKGIVIKYNERSYFKSSAGTS